MPRLVRDPRDWRLSIAFARHAVKILSFYQALPNCVRPSKAANQVTAELLIRSPVLPRFGGRLPSARAVKVEPVSLRHRCGPRPEERNGDWLFSRHDFLNGPPSRTIGIRYLNDLKFRHMMNFS